MVEVITGVFHQPETERAADPVHSVRYRSSG
jgi:tetrahydromethanopterin S-methyltransferase subunit F